MPATRLALVLGTLLAAASAQAKECSTAALRDGASAPRSCAPARPVPDATKGDSVRHGATPGFMALGNGTEMRIGGRVRAETVFQR